MCACITAGWLVGTKRPDSELPSQRARGEGDLAQPVANETTEPVVTEKTNLHPRNKHRGRYDFAVLTAACPALAKFVARNAYGDDSIDFANPDAVRLLNRALLKAMYGISSWDIPPQYLCPPIPGRADHLHHLADLLASNNRDRVPVGQTIRVIDIGVGANVIYPLIGNREYGWSFVGTEIDRSALAAAQATIDANKEELQGIELRFQPSSEAIFTGVMQPKEMFDLAMCNPPFHASIEEARAGTERKWQNLGKNPGSKPNAKPGMRSGRPKPPVLNFGGQGAELCCEGGEEAFISRMVAESVRLPNNILWFTTLVSKSSSLPAVYRALKKADVHDSRTIEMSQGQKKSRIVAWTYLNGRQRQDWAARRWGEAI